MISDVLETCGACQKREHRFAEFTLGSSVWWLIACDCRLRLLEVLGEEDPPEEA